MRAASSKKGQKAETVEYGESWYEQTRRLGAKPGRTVREELGETRAPPRQLGSGLDAQQAVAGMDTALACATGLKDRDNGCMALPGSERASVT